MSDTRPPEALTWYSPCGYSRSGLFVSSGPIPPCPTCLSQAWSTMPFLAAHPVPDSGLSRTASARMRLAREPHAVFDAETVHELLATIDNMIEANLAALASTPEPGLDEAWAQAEAALPEGWRLYDLIDEGRREGRSSEWAAIAVNRHSHARAGQGPTPTATLLALAARLRDSNA